MISGTLSNVAQVTGGTLHGSDATFSGVSTDTRSLQPGQLFFALRGQHLDGEAFVAEAAARGAAGVVVAARHEADVSQVQVADTRLALGDLARHWRARFAIPLVGITGSNGKTTVKEMTAAILRAALRGDSKATIDDCLLVTGGNLNNEIGLPSTLLRLDSGHCAAVLEMGASHPGDIAYLAAIAAPTVGVVTNAARAHLQGFGSVEAVAGTKGELFAALAADATAVINRDDRFFQIWWERSGARNRVSFGLHPDADFRAEAIEQQFGADGPALRFTLCCPAGKTALRLTMAGRHNIANALAASAAAMAAGASLDAIAAGFSGMRNVAGRLRRVAARRGLVLYDDSYNANPGSVRAAIAFLECLPGERWLVLGDMAELGPDSAAMHGEMGEAARRAGVARLYCAGPLSRASAEAFGSNAEWRASVPELIELLRTAVRGNITVLVKGSRSMGMERVVQALAAAGSVPDWDG